jgi:hypothetical protein
MKNKVDIGKLIEKKYKGNTLELSDILEEIDLVLHENITNYEYRREQQPGYIEETDSGNARSIAYHNGAPIDPSNPDVGAPRHKISTDINGNIKGVQTKVVPYKLAEDSPLNESPEIETISVTVPDLFSMITNSELDIKDDDRQIINDIVASFQTSGQHWSENIKAIQEFITENALKKGFNGDLREAIAKLIYLNLFKKISYFTAQPGKLFEYIIAPIIGKDSKVVGKDDQDIIDVNSANANGYSIKLFTGETSQYNVQGSIERLGEASKQIPVQYIIAVVDKQSKIISFAELSVSLNAGHFKGWKEINKTKDGLILSNIENNITKYGILVNVGEDLTDRFSKDVLKILGSNIKTSEIQSNIDSINLFLKNPNIADLKKYVITPFADVQQTVKLQIATELPDSDKKITDKNIFALNQKKPQFFDNLTRYILKQLENAKQQQASLKEAIVENVNAPEGTFNIPIKGSWKSFSSISLELGDPKIYNEFQLSIASEIQKTMVDVLNGFSSLGKNITLYFGSTAHKQMTRRKEMTTYAQSCVDDANKIVTGIKQIATSEGENIK